MVNTWPRVVPVGLAQKGVSERCFQTTGIPEMKKKRLLYYVWDKNLEEWWAPPTHPQWEGHKLFIFRLQAGWDLRSMVNWGSLKDLRLVHFPASFLIFIIVYTHTKFTKSQALLFDLHIWTCLLLTRTIKYDLQIANEETKAQKVAPNLAAGSHSKTGFTPVGECSAPRHPGQPPHLSLLSTRTDPLVFPSVNWRGWACKSF